MPTAKPLQFRSKALHRNVFNVEIPLERKRGWEQWFLISSDRHWDNPHSDQALQREHLTEAARRGAGVIDCGDLFCVMQGKFDKRANKSAIRPEHNVDCYLDAVVDTAIEWFAPWAGRFIMVGEGNHESAIRKRHETDLIQKFVTGLNRHGGNTFYGGYTGWIRFVFRPDDGHKGQHTVTLHYDHGYGGGGPVTRGTIQTNRRAVYLPDADIVISGHIHEAWEMSVPRVRLSDRGVPGIGNQLHICMPTYKDEYGDGFGGWHIETGKPPKIIGAYWLRFYWNCREGKVSVSAIRAE